MFCMNLDQFLQFSYRTLVRRRRTAGSCQRTLFGGADQAKSRAGAFSDLRAGVVLACLRLASAFGLYEAIPFQESATKVPTDQNSREPLFGGFLVVFGPFLVVWSRILDRGSPLDTLPPRQSASESVQFQQPCFA